MSLSAVSVKRLELHQTLAAAFLSSVVVFVAITATLSSVDSDYSRRFGSLTAAEFTSLNAEMDQLRDWLRATLVAGTILDVALIAASVRAFGRGLGAHVILIVGILGGILIAFAWIAAQMPFAPMIG
jgi:hypothetical protein